MRKIYGLLIFVILVTTASIRFNLLEKHFSHVDDLIPSQIYQLLYSDKGKLDKISTKFNVSHNEHLGKVAKPFIYVGYVAFTSTYAPLQFFITYFLINNNQEYKESLFWSRIPSFLFAIFSFLILYLIFKKHFQSEFYTLLIGLTLLCFSWEFIIYSVQAETYAIVIFSCLIFFLLFFNLLVKFDQLKLTSALLYGIIFSILALTQYQIIFILPIIFLLIILDNIKTVLTSIKKLILIISPSIIVITFLYFFVLKAKSNEGIASHALNAGPNNQFFFITNGLDFLESFKYTIHFFTSNAVITFNSLISFGNDSLIINKIFLLFYLLCLIFGIISMVKSTSKIKRFFIYFTALSTIFFMFLIIINKLTLSPTRHSLIYLSYISLIVPEGFLSMIKLIKNNGVIFYNSIILIFCSLVFIIFLFQSKAIINSRIDKFNAVEISDLTLKYKVSNIYSLNWTWKLLFMNSIKKSYEHEFNKNRSSLQFYKGIVTKDSNNILVISHREVDSSAISNDFFAKNIDFSKYKLLYKKEQKSTTEICHYNLSKNGANGLFIYVYGFK